MAGLDLTFDVDGRVITDLGGSDSIRQLLFVDNGKILAVASTSNNTTPIQEIILVRYNSDGSLDTSFGAKGKLSTGLIYGSSVISDDGKIIIVGVKNSGGHSVIRYLANGQLDTSFATNGTYNSNSTDALYSVDIRKNLINNSNEIIVNGQRTIASFTNNILTSKSSSINLILDVNGQVKPLPINSNTTAASIVLDYDVLNRIISSSTVNLGDPAIQNVVNTLGQATIDRLRSQYTQGIYSIQNVAIKPASDGSLLLIFSGALGSITTQSPQYFSWLTNFDSDGNFDPNFGTNGLATFPFIPSSARISGGTFDAQDRIYVAIYDSVNNSIYVFRTTANGRLDPTFGTDGKLSLPGIIGSSVSSSDFFTISVVIDSQNRILVSTKKENESLINIARISNNGTIDTTFGTNGKLQLTAPNGYIAPTSIILGADDRLFLGREVNGDLVVAKYDISGIAAPLPVDFTGGASNDTLNGTAGDNNISGLGGDDSINSGTGKDTIDGGTGYDVLTISNSLDTANTTISYTTATNGVITGGSNHGTTFKNIERLNITTGSGADNIDISATNADYNDYSLINSGAGNDIIKGGDGNDRINSGTGKDTIDGGAGRDLLTISNSLDTANTTISHTIANDGVITGGSSNGTTFKNIERIYITTGSGADNIDISTAGYSNSVDSGAGNDIIKGGAGFDYINSGTGKDTIDGGAGDDLLTISNSLDTANTTISYATVTNGVITGGFNNGTTFKNIEKLNITTGSGADNIDISGATLNYNSVASGAGNDIIKGSAGHDSLNGGAGNDTLKGLGGYDELTGGAGNDLFVLGDANNTFYGGSDEYTRILDFKSAEDKVQLQGLASNYRLEDLGYVTNLYLRQTNTIFTNPIFDRKIAAFQNVTGLNLSSSRFQYVTSPNRVAFSGGAYSANENGTAQVTLVRTGSTVGQISVTLNLINGTASILDYNTSPILVNFDNGETSKVVTIPMIDDNNVEPNETINLTLSNPSVNTGLGAKTTAVFTIMNDDSNVILALAPTTVNEDGTAKLIYTFTRTGVTTNALTVNYGVGGTATLGTDYAQTGAASFTATTGTVTFAAGATTAIVSIDPTTDTVFEANETVALTLASGTGYTVGTTIAVTGSIGNDDTQPTISIADVTVVEGIDGNPTRSLIAVSLSNPSDRAVSVNYGTRNVTAIAASDYMTTTGKLTFNPGQTSLTIAVPIVNNDLDEANETFEITLSTPINATIADNKATVTISDTFSTNVTTTLADLVENLTLTGTANIDGTGNSENNTITGNSGNNILSSGGTPAGFSTGNDTMIGGDGNDTYIIDSTLDIVTEAAGGGIDSIVSSVSYALTDNVENLTLDFGGADSNATGNALNNRITGDSGDNILDGGIGNDTLIGGDGNDTYIIDSTLDVVIENGSFSATDTVESSVNHTLTANVENLILTGTANLKGAGNSENNIITGNSGNNSLTAYGGDDTLSGDAGNDVLHGGAGSDILDGGAGIDYASYYYSTTAITADLTNAANNTGDAAGDTFVGIEYLQGSLTASNLLTGDSNHNQLYGYNGNDTLIGAAGSDYLSAGAGNDSLDGGEGNDNLVGGAGNDNLLGGDGIDRLDGGAGNDTLSGGAGNDVLHGGAGIDALNGGDGIDYASYYSSTIAITADLTNAANNTGDAAGDTFVGIEYLQGSLTASNRLTGDGIANVLYGYNANDTLLGGGGNDYLRSGAGDDSLDGGTGNDYLSGEAGNDTYIVDSTGDTIVEAANSGTDIVRSTVNYTLAVNVETLNLVGAVNGTGNAIANTINGGAGNNVINGGAGNDTLSGGVGSDTFAFGGSSFLNLLSAIGVDSITDFAIGEDKIQLSKTSFAALTQSTGNLLGASFISVATEAEAEAATAAIVYNSSNGNLFYNADANVPGFGINGGQFANFSGAPTLTSNNFTVVA